MDFKGTNEDKVEWDQEGVSNNWFVTIAEGQGIMLVIVQIWWEYNVYIVPSLIMRKRIAPHW